MPVHSIIETFREDCERTLYSLIGEPACKATLFFLYKSLGRDPFEVFWSNPKTFYRELESFLGAGAKVLIELLVSRIDGELGLNMKTEHFLELMQRGDQKSVEEIRSFITRIYEQCKDKTT